MTNNSSKKRILRAFDGEPVDRIPFWFMRQAGRYLPEYRDLRKRSKGFLDFCFSPELAIEATLQPLRRFEMDAAILFSDILVVPYALGQKVEFREGEGPVLDPVRNVSEIRGLDFKGALDRLDPVFRTVRGVAAALDGETGLIGFAGSPWTVATYMVEGHGGTRFEKVKGWAAEDPKGFSELIEILIKTTAQYLIEQVNNGAELIQLFDTWAGVLDKDGFQKWVMEPTERIVMAVKTVHPNIRILGFPKGCDGRYKRFVEATGVDGISLDPTIEPAVIEAELQPVTLVQGNLDPQILVTGGAELEDRTREILRTLSGGRFIFNLGHGIVPETPLENVAMVANIVRQWDPGTRNWKERR